MRSGRDRAGEQRKCLVAVQGGQLWLGKKGRLTVQGRLIAEKNYIRENIKRRNGWKLREEIAGDDLKAGS